MKVKYIGFGGYIELPVYEDENGKLYFDQNNGRNGLALYTGAYRDGSREISGEPNVKVQEKVECDDPFVRSPKEFEYMMLSRLIMDCDYFLGYGDGYEGHLCCKTVEEHCDRMEELWNTFSDKEKPEWTSLERIKQYREQMLRKREERIEKNKDAC